jgi:hypothetical protein
MGTGTVSSRSLRRFPRAAEEQERQHHADPGQHDDGQEGGVEALVQHDERVRIFVCRQVVLGAGDGNRPRSSALDTDDSAWVASAVFGALFVETPRPAWTNRPIRFLRDRCRYF